MTHLAGEVFLQMAGIKLQAVAYRGTGPAMVDLMSGQIPLQMAAILGAVPFVSSGKVKGLGVTAVKRSLCCRRREPLPSRAFLAMRPKDGGQY